MRFGRLFSNKSSPHRAFNQIHQDSSFVAYFNCFSLCLVYSEIKLSCNWWAANSNPLSQSLFHWASFSCLYQCVSTVSPMGVEKFCKCTKFQTSMIKLGIVTFKCNFLKILKFIAQLSLMQKCLGLKKQTKNNNFSEG